MTAAETAGGRRERNKLRTRDALLEAAHRLFAEQGVSATTIASIAEAADVSERTFFRYFAAKEDLLLPGLLEVLRQVEAELRRRPVAEPPMVAIRAAVLAVVPSGAASKRGALIAAGIDPSTVLALASRIAVLAIDWERRFAVVLFERLRTARPEAPDTELALRAGVIACAAMSACRVALRLYREGAAGQVSAADLISQGFSVLEGGLSAG